MIQTTSLADRVATELRDRRSSDHGTGACDALNPCRKCRDDRSWYAALSRIN